MAQETVTESVTEAEEDHRGMTDEQWAQWLAYTRGYGEQDENGVDVSLLRQNLRLTPWERLKDLQGGANFLATMRHAETEIELFAIFQALAAARIRCLLIGAVAMCLHGSAYLTRNVDVCLADESGSHADFAALAEEHAPYLRAFPVSLLGVGSFDCLWARSACFDVGGIPIHAASLDDLIAMKQYANRRQDHLHLMELMALRKLILSGQTAEE